VSTEKNGQDENHHIESGPPLETKQAYHLSTMAGLINQRLQECERAYRYGNLGAVLDGIYWCNEGKIPHPEWLNIAVSQIVASYLKGEKLRRRGRQARWPTQYVENQVDYARHEAVLECIDHGIQWLHAYAKAADLLQGQFGEGSEDAIEKSYKRVNINLKLCPGKYYILHSIRIERKPLKNKKE